MLCQVVDERVEYGAGGQRNGDSRIQLKGQARWRLENPLCLTTRSLVTWNYFFVI